MNEISEKVERKAEELLANKFPAKFSEHLKISFLFENKTHKYYRMDYYNYSNDNHIDRSYFVMFDKTTNEISARN